MGKYNKGDKFEIEIEDILLSRADGGVVYLIKGLPSLILDDHGLDILKQIKHEEPEVDWTKVPVDTPVLVTNNRDGNWYKGHFEKYEDGKVHIWTNGTTSWTAACGISTSWKYAKLAEVEE